MYAVIFLSQRKNLFLHTLFTIPLFFPQRALLEQKQRRKRQEPLMVQPNTEARPRRSRTRRGEEQAPLVESHLSITSDAIMGGKKDILYMSFLNGLSFYLFHFLSGHVYNHWHRQYSSSPTNMATTHSEKRNGSTNFLSGTVVGIDGPAAILGSEATEIGTKIQIVSVGKFQHQLEEQCQPQSPSAEETDRDGDTETLLEPKTDIHELLQKQGQ